MKCASRCPPKPGEVARYDGVYVRHDVASLFLAFEPLASWRHVAVTDTRKCGTGPTLSKPFQPI
jgi:hypothetical protein